MYNSSPIVKNNFIQLSSKNTRVIDPNALMAKKMEGFSGILRERPEDTEDDFQPSENDEAIDALTGESDATLTEEFAEPDVEDVAAQCERMLSEAKQNAEEILSNAGTEAEGIRNSARDEGYEEGYSKGREAALQELLSAKKELESEKETLRAHYEKLVNDIEPQMVNVITGVYEHVFGANFYSRRDVMACLINKALIHTEADSQIVIYVSPLDYDMLIGMKNTLYEKVAFREEPEIRQREDFIRGQAKIETPYGLIDCSIDTELKELRRMLKVLSYEGKNEA